MTDNVQILQSNKASLDSKESYIVTRDKTSFLRILGSEPEWELMTATASEDSGDIKVCSNQLRLIEVALRLGAELETEPRIKEDWMGREYVKICIITQESGQNDQDFNKELSELFSRFFELFDGCENLASKAEDEMRGLYNALAIDDCGSDVYLSDGVWLSSDGSLHDRGR